MARGPELYGNAPRAVRWSGDGQRVYFQWKRASDPLDKDYDTYVVGRDGSGLMKLSEEDSRLAPPLNGHETKDHQRVVYTDRGDLFIYDRATDRRRQLTKTSDTESNPRWTKDNKRVAFVRGGNLYTISLEDGLVEQWTDIRPAGAASGRGPRCRHGRRRRARRWRRCANRRKSRRTTRHRKPGVPSKRKSEPCWISLSAAPKSAKKTKPGARRKTRASRGPWVLVRPPPICCSLPTSPTSWPRSSSNQPTSRTPLSPATSLSLPTPSLCRPAARSAIPRAAAAWRWSRRAPARSPISTTG